MKNIFRLIIVCFLAILISHQAVAQYYSSGFSAQRAADRAAYFNWLQYQKTKGEGGNLRKWWKEESTVGISVSGPVTYTEQSHYDSTAYSSQKTYDSVITGKAKPQISLHANGNSNHLLVRLSDNSILSLSIGFQVDWLRWKFEPFNGNELKTTSESLNYAQFGMPVTLDYKKGCDVDFDAGQKICYAFGAGVMPLTNFSFDGITPGDNDFRVAPYFYASFGFYALGCWKIRAGFIPGKYSIFKDLKINDGGGVINTLNIQGNSIFTLGISRMAYSADWGEGRGTRGGGISGHGGGRRVRNRGNGRMF